MSNAAWLLNNPDSGKGESGPLLREAARDRVGVSYYTTRDADHLAGLINKAIEAHVPRVVVAGGDATIHLAINALMAHAEAPGGGPAELPSLGIVPVGTANDLARSLGLPMDLKEALRVALDIDHQPIDVLRLESSGHDGRPGGRVRYAVNAVTGGLSVRIHDEMDAEVKKWWGGFAYAKTMLGVIGDANNYEVTLTADGEPRRGEAFGLVVANGSRAGGQVLVPTARLDDGLAEAALVCAPDGPERIKLLAEFAAGVHMDSPRVQWSRTRRVVIQADPAMPLIADGERCGDTPVEIQVMHHAIHIAAPADLHE